MRGSRVESGEIDRRGCTEKGKDEESVFSSS